MPFLTNIEIEHYRGFYSRRQIAPAVPNDNNGSGLTVLVGPNNSGKSTVINAIRSVARGPRQIDVEHRHLDHPLVLALTNDSQQKKVITNPDLGATTVLEGELNFFPSDNDIRIVPSRRAWNPYTGTDRMVERDYWSRQIQIEEQDNFLVSRVAVFSKDERKRFTDLLSELLPQIDKWRIELSRGQTFIQYETQSGARHAADLFGDGMASIFRIALSLFDSAAGKI